MREIIFLLFIASILSVSLVQAGNARGHLSSKTPYQWRLGGKHTAPAPKGQVLQVHLVARHGTRLPTKKDTKKLYELHRLVQQRVDGVKEASAKGSIRPGYDWLATWSPNLDMSDAGELLPFGELELYGLGRRFSARYPSLFAAKYDPDDIEVHSTQKSRAGQSASAFVQGVYEGTGVLGPSRLPSFHITSRGLESDRLHRFFDHCPRYERTVSHFVGQGDDVYSELFNSFLANYTARTCNSDNDSQSPIGPYCMSRRELSLWWTACVWETVMYEKSESQFCSLFNAEAMQAFEYLEDSKSYHKKGYHNAINYEMACPLLGEIGESISQKAQHSTDPELHAAGHSPNAVLRFAHGETILPILATLGLYKDDADIFDRAQSSWQRVKERRWRPGRIVPFAGNIELVLSRLADQYLVTVRVNEEEVLVPGCSALSCPLKEFSTIVSRVRHDCDFDRICATAVNPHNNYIGTIQVISLVVVCAFMYWVQPFTQSEKPRTKQS